MDSGIHPPPDEGLPNAVENRAVDSGVRPPLGEALPNPSEGPGSSSQPVLETGLSERERVLAAKI